MNTSLFPAASLLVRSLGWALFSSLWQGLLLFLVLSIVLKLLKAASAQVKYLISAGSLTILCLWFLNSWYNQWQHLQQTTIYITQTANDHVVTKSFSVSQQPSGFSFGTYLHQLFPVIDKYFPVIITLYVLGLLFMLLRFGVNLYSIQSLRRQGIAAPDKYLEQLVSQWQERFGIVRKVELFFSNRVNVPVMLGSLKPVILLPVSVITQLGAEQIEAILLHELAHIKRHDYLLNILQTLIETILFFNPFMWWMSAIIRREREHCCDDIVVKHTSHSLSYAKALASLEIYKVNNSPIALAATGKKNQLFNRIKRITEMKKSSVNYTQAIVAMVLIIGIITSVAVLSPTFAQKVKKDKDKTANTSSGWKVEEKYTYIDSNGHKRTYHSVDEIPANQRSQALKAIKKQKTVVVSIDKRDEDKSDMGSSAEDLKNASAEMADAAKEMASLGLSQAMKNIDWDQISDAISEAGDQVKNIDWDKISDQIKVAMDEADKQISDPKVHAEMMEEMHKGMQEAKAEMAKAKVEMIKGRAEAMKNLHEAQANRASVAHVRTDNVNDMINEMANDGLIDKSKDFDIKMNDNDLYIDGNIQPHNIFDKYHRFVNGKDVIVNKKDGKYTVTITKTSTEP